MEDYGFKHKIGEVLMHATALALYGGAPVMLFVAGRRLEQGPDHTRRLYLCRMASVGGNVNDSLVAFDEAELVPWVIAEAQPGA